MIFLGPEIPTARAPFFELLDKAITGKGILAHSPLQDRNHEQRQNRFRRRGLPKTDEGKGARGEPEVSSERTLTMNMAPRTAVGPALYRAGLFTQAQSRFFA